MLRTSLHQNTRVERHLRKVKVKMVLRFWLALGLLASALSCGDVDNYFEEAEASFDSVTRVKRQTIEDRKACGPGEEQPIVREGKNKQCQRMTLLDVTLFQGGQ